ncbi:hypothetical protein JCM6882_002905 [Rhodosporidiobolus microsporus]
MPATDEEPCHKEACAIQNCLMNNSYQESRCQTQLLKLWRCCEEFYRLKGEDARCSGCPRPDALRLKLDRIERGE